MEESMKNEILNAIQSVNVKVDYIQTEVAKLPKIEKQISEMQKQVAKIPKIEKQISEMQKEIAKIPEMQKQIAKIPEMQKEIAKIPQIEKQISEMQKEIAKIPEMQKDIRSISRSVAVIEYEHGNKLEALFDAFTMTREKIEEQEKRSIICEKKIEKYDTEIGYLMSKVQGL